MSNLIARLAALTAPALALLAAPALARGQEPKADPRALVSEVKDTAGVFSPEAVRKARDRVERVERERNAAVVIETVRSLGDEPIKEATTRRARGLRKDGVYVLIDKANHHLALTPTRGLEAAFNAPTQLAVRDAFLGEFRKGDFDAGLERGLDRIEEAARALPRGEAREGVFERLGRGPGSDDKAGSDLVLRGQVRLKLAAARLIVAGAEAKAAEMGLKVNVAVVDDGGHLLSFDRMDGARPASGYTALTKATTAATFRQETGPLPKGAAQPDPLLNLSLQNAASASGGKVTTLYGGVPVVLDGQIIGAVGVGGGTGEQDAQVAKAGIARLMAELGAGEGGEPRRGQDGERPALSR